jgi:hypothetical protein
VQALENSEVSPVELFVAVAAMKDPTGALRRATLMAKEASPLVVSVVTFVSWPAKVFPSP